MKEVHDMITTSDPNIKGTVHKVAQFDLEESLVIGNALQCYKDYLEKMIDEIPTEKVKQVERDILKTVNKLVGDFKDF